MLPLSRDKMRIAVCQDRVIAVRWHGKTIVSKETVQAEGKPLAALENLLAGVESARVNASVILSNHFFKFMLLPWNDALLSIEEQFSLARHRFLDIYGGQSAHWDIRLSEGTMGAPSMASALDREFLVELRGLFSAAQIKLTSIQPYLMHVFNSVRNEFGTETGWFVLVERGLYCIALFTGKHWQRIKISRMIGNGFDELALTLERESLLAEEGTGRKVYLYAPDYPELAKSKTEDSWFIQPVTIKWLPGFTPSDASSYAMVALGA